MISCAEDGRAAVARAHHLNGIDGIDVSVDQRTLTVLLFGKAPEDLTVDNFRIDGGRQVTGVKVVDVQPCRNADPELTDCLLLTVDRHGDFSRYRLCIVAADPHGGPGTAPLAGFDPRYACVTFSFKQNCPQLTDCATPTPCPPTAFDEPEIDYLAKDYASFSQLLLDRLSLTIPSWTERHAPDIGIALVELLAATGDRLSYRQDATATESYLDTARLRVSVRRHARLVDYAMHDGCAARAWVRVETSQDITLAAGDFRFAALPADLRAMLGPATLAGDLQARNPAPYEVFEPVFAEDVALFAAHNAISIWSWGGRECWLPAGTTEATLVDGSAGENAGENKPQRALRLRAGDVLIFREIRGATTCEPADADTSHVHAVRLTSVEPGFDALYGQPVLDVSWAREDALPFDLCVTARCGADCTMQEIGVAHGNIILVDHGRTLNWCQAPPEEHPLPPARPGVSKCCSCRNDGCCSHEPVEGPPYPPDRGAVSIALDRSPVTQVVPFPTPENQSRAQARVLAGVPDRARARLSAMLAGEGPPTADDVAYLHTLFGPAVPDLGDPLAALTELLNRFDELLSIKLARLGQLVRRAYAGYLLDISDGWEIGESWGAEERQAVDPAGAALRGPASAAAAPDPAAALPAARFWVAGDPAQAWLAARDLMDVRQADRLFVGEVDDAGVLTARFGPSTPTPSTTIEVGYRLGNGIAGNVGATAINTIVFCSSRQDAISVVSNPQPAFGGVEPEPVDRVRQIAPYEPTHLLRRAVTEADYAELAAQVPGVQRAAASLRWLGCWYEMQVAVDPFGADVAPQWLLDAVRDALYPYRRIGHDLTVRTAHLVPLQLALRVDVTADRIAAHVRASAMAALEAFFRPDNLTFGQPVRVSQIVAVAAGVPGVRHAEVTTLQPLFGPPGTALRDGLLILGPLDIAQLDNDPSQPDNGLITLTMAGGR
jgi:predicted phage baseplate assembly protein